MRGSNLTPTALTVASAAKPGATGSRALAMMADGAGPDVAVTPPIARVVEPATAFRGAFEDAQARYRKAYGAAAALA